jgi:hypothetical protein
MNKVHQHPEEKMWFSPVGTLYITADGDFDSVSFSARCVYTGQKVEVSEEWRMELMHLFRLHEPTRDCPGVER